jgi:hypothetical protein
VTTAATPPGAVAAKLKICLITEPLDAGVGRHVSDVACTLAER